MFSPEGLLLFDKREPVTIKITTIHSTYSFCFLLHTSIIFLLKSIYRFTQIQIFPSLINAPSNTTIAIVSGLLISGIFPSVNSY